MYRSIISKSDPNSNSSTQKRDWHLYFRHASQTRISKMPKGQLKYAIQMCHIKVIIINEIVFEPSVPLESSSRSMNHKQHIKDNQSDLDTLMLVRFVSPCLNKFGPSWPHTCVQAWPKDDATNKFNVTEASVQDWTRWPLRTQYYQLPLGFGESLFVAGACNRSWVKLQVA